MYGNERRVRLKKGKQKELISHASNIHGSVKKLSQEMKIPYSTMKGYSREENLLPENLFDKITTFLKIKKFDLNPLYLDANWGRKLGAKRGMVALVKKYPNKIKFWRARAAKKSHFNNIKIMDNPKLDERLAEFIGIYLGDGTINKYQVRISGDYRYDRPYFIIFLNLSETYLELDLIF